LQRGVNDPRRVPACTPSKVALDVEGDGPIECRSLSCVIFA